MAFYYLTHCTAKVEGETLKCLTMQALSLRKKTRCKMAQTMFQHVFCDSLSGLKAAYEAGLSPQIKVLTRSPAILEAMPSNSMNLDEYAGVNPDKINSFFFGTSSSLLEIKDIIDSEPHLASYSTLVCRDLWNWQQHALFSIF